MSTAVTTAGRRDEALPEDAEPVLRGATPFISGTLANLALFTWLGGVLVFGRAFSQIGVEPLFLADLLAAAGVALSLPRWWPSVITTKVRGFLLIAVALFVLTGQSVYRGAEASHPSALKTACMGVYPLVAVAIAGLVARDPEIIQRFAKRVLPYVPVGFLLVALVDRFFIAAASALYLACAAAWALAPGNMRLAVRGALVVGITAGAGYLTAVGARRGPTIAIVLALAATYIAVRRRRRIQHPQELHLTIVVFCLSGALLATTVLVLLNGASRIDPADLPVFGTLASRVVTTTQRGTESGNNAELRLEIWRYALSTTVEQHPFIGLGAGKPVSTNLGLRAVVDDKSGVHNSFIGYAFYSGLPSAILVLLAFWWAGFGTWRNRTQGHCAFLFGATVAVATTCMTNVALETPYIAGPAWAVLGAAVGAATVASNDRRLSGQGRFGNSSDRTHGAEIRDGHSSSSRATRV
jgi:hypothetical protein